VPPPDQQRCQHREGQHPSRRSRQHRLRRAAHARTACPREGWEFYHATDSGRGIVLPLGDNAGHPIVKAANATADRAFGCSRGLSIKVKNGSGGLPLRRSPLPAYAGDTSAPGDLPPRTPPQSVLV
jgi:hypothetical protein